MASTTASTSHMISNLTMGADADGVDLKVFGDTSGAYMLWDASANNLLFTGAAGLSYGTLSSDDQTGISLSSTNPTVLDVFADDNDTALTNAVYHAIRGRTMLFKTPTEGSIFSVMGQIKCADEVDFNPGVFAGVRGYIETMDDTDIKSGAKMWAVDACIDATLASATVKSGGIMGGVHAELTGAGTFVQDSGGILAGVYIDETATSGNWGYGLYMVGTAVQKAIQIGTLSSDSQTGVALSSSNPNVIDSFADDNDTALTNAVYTNIRARTMLFKTPTEGSLYSVLGQIKMADEVDFNPGVFAGVRGYLESMDDTDVKSGAKVWAVEGCLDATLASYTVKSGGISAGLHAELTGAGTFTQDSGGILAGLYIDEQATSGQWGYGVYVASGGAATGLYIGNAATAIDVAGTLTTSGLNFCNATMPVASDNVSLINIGTYDTGLSSAASTDNTFAIMNNRTSTADDAYWFMNEYMKISMTTADQTSKSFVNLAIRQAIAKPVAATYGIQSHLTFSGTGDVASEIIALSAQIAGTAATGSGLHWGVKSDLRATNTPSGAGHESACFFGVGTVSCSSGLNISALGSTTMYSGAYFHAAGDMTNVIEVQGAANVTYLLKFDAASSVIVEDTGTPGAAATHKIKCQVGSTTFYLAGYADF